MLTREEAREKTCPYRIATQTPEYHQNGEGVAYNHFEYARCVAEKCPKWVDDCPQLARQICSEWRTQCEKTEGKKDWDRFAICDACPQHYGRCGG